MVQPKRRSLAGLALLEPGRLTVTSSGFQVRLLKNSTVTASAVSSPGITYWILRLFLTMLRDWKSATGNNRGFVAHQAHDAALEERYCSATAGDPGQRLPDSDLLVEHAIELVAPTGPDLVQLNQRGEIDPRIGQLGAVAGAQDVGEGPGDRARGYHVDQPASDNQTGSLRVTMQLIRRLERCDRLSVARMRMASSADVVREGDTAGTR